MMRKTALISICFLLSCICMGGERLKSTLEWIKYEKIKATYTWMHSFHHAYPEGVVSDLADAGFNSIILKDAKDFRTLWLKAAEKHDIKLFICFNYWSIPDSGVIPDKVKKFRKAVYDNGKESLAPCPLNEDYWEEIVLPPQLELAELSREHDCVRGLVMDTEMYGIKPHAYLNDVCFCDDCFENFLKSIEKYEDEKVAPEKRKSWLKEKKLLDSYYAHLQKRFTEIAANFRKAIHEVNPDLMLGNLNFVDAWFFRGLLKGFGTAEVPAISLPESPTYDDGYTPFVEKQKEFLKKNDFHVIYVPGIFNRSFFPDDLAVNTFKLAVNTDGYFDFTIRALYGLIDDFNKDLMFKCKGDLRKYWNAYKYANSEIGWKVRLGKYYTSPLELKTADLLANKKVISSSLSVADKEASLLLNENPEPSASVKFNIPDGEKNLTMVIDLGSVTGIKRVRALCQGGGFKGGVYFPAAFEVYGNESNGDASASGWELAGKATEPDIPFSFPENADHSNSFYLRWITVDSDKIGKYRFLKLVFLKKSDKDVRSKTKNEKAVSRIIEIEKIEAYSQTVWAEKWIGN